MLFEDITHGALVYGIRIPIDELTSDRLRELDALVKSHKPLVFWVPGDTVYGDPTGDALLGIPIAIVAAYDDPTEVKLTKFEQAKKQFDAAKAKHFDKLTRKSPAIADIAENEPATYLTCCGPLCYATLSYGELWPSDQRDDAEYTFHSFQDMDQMWRSEGVDGITLGTVEYNDLCKIDVNPERIERLGDKVANKKNPALWICVRYD